MLYCNVEQLEGNATLRRDWHDLLSRVRPELRLFGPEWYSIWDRTIGAQPPWTGSLQVAAVRDDSRRLVGVLPVGHPKVALLKVNAMGGYFQPWRGILADRAGEYEVGRALGWFLIELNWNVLQLGPWPRSHAAHRGVLSALEELGVFVQQQNSCGLAIAELPPTWDEFQGERIGLKLLRSIRNSANKLVTEHRIDIRHLRNPSLNETRDMLSALAHIEQRSWLPTDPHGRPRFIAPVHREFWMQLASEWLIPQDWLDCWLLSADGQPISFVFALTLGETRYVIANQYDEAWSHYRPGSILYRHMFEDGYRRGVNRYDFGTNELHDKQQWGASYLDHIDTYTVATNRLVSSFLHAGVKLKGLFDGSLWGQAQPCGRETLASGELAPVDESAPYSFMADESTFEGSDASSPSDQELLVTR